MQLCRTFISFWSFDFYRRLYQNVNGTMSFSNMRFFLSSIRTAGLFHFSPSSVHSLEPVESFNCSHFSSTQIQTTPYYVTSAMIRSWSLRRSLKGRGERAGGTPPDALAARAAIPAVLAFPSAQPCCPLHCA